jgi:hypothetical protein
MKRIIAIAIAAALSAPAYAGFYDGNELHEFCSKPAGTPQNNFCIAYVAGAADAYSGIAFCPPNGVKLGQVVDVVKKVLTDVPTIRNKPADEILLAVLGRWHPCKEAAPPARTEPQRNPRGGNWS